MPRMSADDDRSTTVRAMSVLDALACAGRPLTLSEIASRASLPLPTTHRYLKELLVWGGIERTSDGWYQVGKHIWLLGAASRWERRVRQTCSPLLDRLVHATGHAVALTTLTDDRLICLDRRFGASKSVILCDTGEDLPLLTSSAGKVLVAQKDADYVHQILTAPVSPRVLYPGTRTGFVDKRIAAAKRSGYSVAWGEIHPQQASVSVPVPVLTGDDSLALTVLVPVDTRNIEGLVPSLKMTAASIATHLRRANVELV